MFPIFWSLKRRYLRLHCPEAWVQAAARACRWARAGAQRTPRGACPRWGPGWRARAQGRRRPRTPRQRGAWAAPRHCPPRSPHRATWPRTPACKNLHCYKARTEFWAAWAAPRPRTPRPRGAWAAPRPPPHAHLTAPRGFAHLRAKYMHCYKARAEFRSMQRSV